MKRRSIQRQVLSLRLLLASLPLDLMPELGRW